MTKQEFQHTKFWKLFGFWVLHPKPQPKLCPCTPVMPPHFSNPGYGCALGTLTHSLAVWHCSAPVPVVTVINKVTYTYFFQWQLNVAVKIIAAMHLRHSIQAPV